MKPLPLIAALLLSLYLGIHDGYLALFENEANTPAQVLPYRAALYPKIDQSALKAGIPIESGAHLKQLLEDFLA